MTSSSRMNKYKDLREGIKDKVGIPQESATQSVDVDVDIEGEDDFLSLVNRKNSSSEKKEAVNIVEDTLIEAKTFDQLRIESSEEIDKALRSAKSNVGKKEKYNTRMDILNKIRYPEKEIIKIDKMENISTDQFAKGFFTKSQEEDIDEDVESESVVEEVPKKKMTLMERLVSMSPKEDGEKAKKVLQVENGLELNDNTIEEDERSNPIEATDSIEDMLSLIKERDRKQIEQAKKQNVKVPEKTEETSVFFKQEENTKAKEEIVNKGDQAVTVLNYIIFALIIVFMVLCCLIAYQIFF